MEIPPEGRDHESERERLCLLQSHWGCRMVRQKEKKTHRQSNRRRNSVTPSIQLTDCSISFHILQLDFISGNFESEYADKPKGLWATVQPGCHQKQSPSFAGWATYSGRGKPVNRVLSLYLSLYLFPERVPAHWKVSISHRSGVVDQDDPTCRGRSQVIHHNPVDENHLLTHCSRLTGLTRVYFEVQT